MKELVVFKRRVAYGSDYKKPEGYMSKGIFLTRDVYVWVNLVKSMDVRDKGDRATVKDIVVGLLEKGLEVLGKDGSCVVFENRGTVSKDDSLQKVIVLMEEGMVDECKEVRELVKKGEYGLKGDKFPSLDHVVMSLVELGWKELK